MGVWSRNASRNDRLVVARDVVALYQWHHRLFTHLFLPRLRLAARQQLVPRDDLGSDPLGMDGTHPHAGNWKWHIRRSHNQHICADCGQLCPIRHLRTDFGRDRRSADGTYSSCRASCLSLRFVGKPGRLRGPTKALSSMNISRPLLDTALSGTLSRFSQRRLIDVSQTSPQSIK
jgi:hypothetical protein